MLKIEQPASLQDVEYVTCYEKRDRLDKISISNNCQNVKNQIFFTFLFFSLSKNIGFWLHIDILCFMFVTCKM